MTISKLKILYLEDSELDVESISRLLEEESIDYKLYHVNNERDFLNTLRYTDIDIILADYSTPSFSGTKALELVRSEFSEIPFIILSGVTGEEIAVDLLKNGATDFILKQRLGRLIPSIRRALLETRERARRMKEENLRRKYDFIINTSRSMFSLVDQKYTYEAVNDAFCHAHNLVRDQVIGKTLADLWGKDVFAKYIKQNFDRSFSDHVVRYQAWFNVPKYGLRCFEVTFYPYREKGDVITHTVVDTLDITDRQKAEEALQDSEAKYRMLFDHAVEAIFLVKDRKIIACNNKTSEYFGYPRKKMLQKDPFFFSSDIQPDGSRSPDLADQLMKQASDGNEMEFEWTFRKMNGQDFLCQVSITGFRLKGQPFFQFFIQDVTEKIRTAETRKQLVTAIEQSAELMMITDVHGNIEYVNNAFVETTGFSREDLMNMSYMSIVFGNYDEDQFLGIRKTLMDHKFWSGQADYRSKDNRPIKVHASVSPVRNAAGDITNYVIVSRDLTEESRIRTYLQQAQKMETIGTLAGGIAHDFNNILTTIIGHSDMALKDIDDDHPVNDDIRQIMKAADRAKTLINQILTFSRQVEKRDEHVDVPVLVDEIVELLSVTLPANISIKQKAAPGCPPISADPAQLHQILMNICTNGIHAMRDSGGTLSITIDCADASDQLVNGHPDLEKGPYLLLTITDTGKGMDAATRERIFEPFFTTKPVGEGTGLGLSVVHGIVMNLKGKITVRSQPDKGSSFTVFLPA